MSHIIHVLREGYSYLDEASNFRADCTVTLIRGGQYNILVDTGGAWCHDILVKALQDRGLSCDDIDYIICTHGHSDHIGNLNLFSNATCILGGDMNRGDKYFVDQLFKQDTNYVIEEGVELMSTPGHTTNDVSVIVKTEDKGCVVVAGDLFEKEEDQKDEKLWRDMSFNPSVQEGNRQKMLTIADWIVPGHGPMFKVNKVDK